MVGSEEGVWREKGRETESGRKVLELINIYSFTNMSKRIGNMVLPQLTDKSVQSKMFFLKKT
jgi:hypothetical protein